MPKCPCHSKKASMEQAREKIGDETKEGMMP